MGLSDILVKIKMPCPPAFTLSFVKSMFSKEEVWNEAMDGSDFERKQNEPIFVGCLSHVRWCINFERKKIADIY